MTPERRREIARNWARRNKHKKKAYDQRYHAEHPTSRAHRKRWWRYKLTPEQYQEMLVEQNNKCLGCLKELEQGRDTQVDHCHKSGRVRGILCQKCNITLGASQDSIEILERLITYLKRHEEYTFND